MRSYRYWIDICVTLCLLYIPIGILQPDLLNLDRLPTGGDTASHIFYIAQFCHYFPSHGLTQWLPEVFGGFPFLSYYFPLPFIGIFLLNQFLPLALAAKWGMFLAGIVMPAVVYGISVLWLGFSRSAGLLAGIAALAFLLHEQNSIWGGNLLSTLAGEFAYSYGMLFSLLTVSIWIKALQGRHLWLLGGILEAAAGFSHGYALLITGFSSFYLLLCGNFKQSLRFLLLAHGSAFFLLAGWLWPLLEMHGLTIPNDGAYMWSQWQEFLPKTLWPILGIGILGLLLLLFGGIRRNWQAAQQQAVAFMLSAAILAATFWLSAVNVGLADIRFFPYIWLFSSIVCAWLCGESLAAFFSKRRNYVLWLSGATVISIAIPIVLWLYHVVEIAPQWSQWNHSGYEAKPQWRNLTNLFPALSGSLNSPRLIFEHDPANNDLGSTRALEALPMFLHGRPVLEGLYMESALLSPAIYQTQSEISQQPSSPLVRFPSGFLDPSTAAVHMQLLHADTALLRNTAAKQAVEASGAFIKIAENPPFTLYRLRNFASALISLAPLPLKAVTKENWLNHAFSWFKHYPRMDFWPVYTFDDIPPDDKKYVPPPVAKQNIKLLQFEHEKIHFTTAYPGRPHLLKMAYHPRWQLATPGKIYLAAPGYMMIVPESAEVELKYGNTAIGNIGIIASLITFMAISLLFITDIWTKKYRHKELHFPSAAFLKGLCLWSVLLGSLSFYAWLSSAERLYSEAWIYMHNNDYKHAAEEFDHAYAGRRVPAKQEEALFWSAKANELAGQRLAADERYSLLVKQFDGYWLPESLYTLGRLKRMQGNELAALYYEQRLRSEFPRHHLLAQMERDKQR